MAHRSSVDLHDLPFNTSIMQVNIQGLRSHLAELCAVMRLCVAPPDIICVNETFLDDGVEIIEPEGYEIIGRRDRSFSGDERRCGGIIVHARASIASNVTLFETSAVSERMWFQMHSNNGPYLLCCWYRPPVQGEVASITSFMKELSLMRQQVIGTLLVGDLNLHCRRWLIHSAGNTCEGEMMRDECLKNGFRQLVREPTRGDHLLDLSITDIESAHASVSGKIADHAVVTTELNLTLPQTISHKRKVWSYTMADWNSFKGNVCAFDWSFMGHCDATRSAELLTESVLTVA